MGVMTSIALFVVSTAYQMHQQRKAKQAAKDAANRRPNIDPIDAGEAITVAGNIADLPIIYGRVKMGGVRVFQNVQNTFEAATSNADAVWNAGYDGYPDYTQTNRYNDEGYPKSNKDFDGVGGYLFENDMTADRRDFLFFQQSICVGPIEGVMYVEIDDKPVTHSSFAVNFNSDYVPGYTGSYGMVPYEDREYFERVGMHINEDACYIDMYGDRQCGGQAYECTSVKVYAPHEGCVKVLDPSRAGDYDPEASAGGSCNSGGQEYMWDCSGNVTKSEVLLNAKGLRVEVHNNGGINDMLTLNCKDRLTATFTDQAYANCVIKLNSKDPQFYNIPPLSFYMKGRKIRTFNAEGILLEDLTYSANPALCLLDYLLSPLGKGLTEAEVDFESFFNATKVCDTVVVENQKVGGKAWGDTRVRQLPLFECNIVASTTKTFRENINNILETMGNARLVWSLGKYKLILQYPTENSEIVVAEVVTDEMILMPSEFKISYPGLDTRLNFCSVSFKDADNNFKEATAYYPEIDNNIHTRGVGGITHEVPPAKLEELAEDDENDDDVDFLKTYGAWGGTEGQFLSESAIYLKEADTYTIKFSVSKCNSAGPNSKLTIYDSDRVSKGGLSKTHTPGIQSMDLALDVGVHFVSYQIRVSSAEKVAAISIEDSSGRIIWTTRDLSYQDIEVTQHSDTYYLELLEQDNNLKLSSEISMVGATDYQHALAKAKETLVKSREGYSIEFQYIIRGSIPEPGDYIQIESIALDLSGDYFLVDSIEIAANNVASVSCIYFDASHIAWSNPVDEVAPSTPVTTDYAPYGVVYDKTTDTLSWEIPAGAPATTYVVEYSIDGDPRVSSGSTSGNSLVVNLVGCGGVSFFVIPADSGTEVASGSNPLRVLCPGEEDLYITASNNFFYINVLGWGNPRCITLTANYEGTATGDVAWTFNGITIPDEVTDTLVVLPSFEAEYLIYTATIGSVTASIEIRTIISWG